MTAPEETNTKKNTPMKAERRNTLDHAPIFFTMMLGQQNWRLWPSKTEQLANVEGNNAKLLDQNKELEHPKDVLRKMKEGVPTRIALAVKNENQKVTTHHLREDGSFSEACTNLVREMVGCGVPINHMNNVIHTVCDTFGLGITDTISVRSVGQIVAEGGVASQMQLGYEIAATSRKSHFLLLRLKQG